jgi:hypothetical protein
MQAAPQPDAAAAKPLSILDITALFDKGIADMKATMVDGFVTHKKDMADEFVTHKKEMAVQMTEHSTSLNQRIDTKFLEYDAAMGIMTAEAKGLATSVAQLSSKIDDNVKATDDKFAAQQMHMTAELDKFKKLIHPGPIRQRTSPRREGRETPSSDFAKEIVIDGIRENDHENLDDICQLRVFNLMGLEFGEANIDSCTRLGREFDIPEEDRGHRVRPRPVLVRFKYSSCKDVCIRRSFKLRGKGFFINEHFSPAIERRRKRLYPIVRKARHLDYEDRIALVDDKIVLDGNEIGIDDFDKLPDDIHPRDIATEKRGDVTFFFRTDSPLSNHHMCNFSMAGVNYNCSEQAYFHKKAIICGDDGAKKRIMMAKYPGVQKSIGEAIKETPDWKRQRITVMTQVCGEKFRQNPELRTFLDKTAPTYLAEDNPRDDFWAIAMSRNSPRASNRMNFKANNLGVILMDIRDTIN